MSDASESMTDVPGPDEPAPRIGIHGPDIACHSALEAWQAGRFEEAEGLLRADLPDDNGASPSQDRSTLLFDLGRLYSDWKRFDLAADFHRQALSARQQELGPRHEAVAESLSHLAWALWQSGRGREAEQALRQARPIAEAALGRNAPLVVNILTNLALLIAENGGADDDEEEESLLRMALEAREGAADDVELASALNNLANLFSRRGNFDEAILLHRRALGLREANLPTDHPDMAESLGNLGRALMDSSRRNEAETLLWRAADIEQRSAAGAAANNPRLINLLERLAELRRGKKDYASAIRLLEQALALQRQHQGPEHLDVAGTLNNLAGLYTGLGFFAQAQHACLRSLEIRRAALGPESPATVQSLRNLAFIAMAQGYLEEAERLCREAMDLVVARRAGPEHPDAAAVMDQLATVLECKGTNDEARTLRTRANAVRDQASDSDLLEP